MHVKYSCTVMHNAIRIDVLLYFSCFWLVDQFMEIFLEVIMWLQAVCGDA